MGRRRFTTTHRLLLVIAVLLALALWLFPESTGRAAGVDAHVLRQIPPASDFAPPP